MFNCLTTHAHRLRVLIKTLLHGFEHVLVSRPRNTDCRAATRCGVRKDTKQGIRWLSLAAYKGQYQAQAFLGALLFKGQSVYRDGARGLMWLMLARDAATPGETWITDQYIAAWKLATETDRNVALVYVEKWIEQYGGRRE
jgi:hypothetical protein